MTNFDSIIVKDNKFVQPSFITRFFLPSKRVPKDQQSIWNILKNAIGRDLSRLTTPIVFNEPLSFIQRLAEYMENSYLLDKAAQCQDPCERLELIGVFAISSMSSIRVSKPFNPLLFETYELEKSELGFRFISEQVSHHPPVSAFHAFSINGNYEFYGTVAPKLKFWGRSIECEPRAHFTVNLLKLNETYEWKAVNISIHNIILGEMFMALNGLMIINCSNSSREFRVHFNGASNNGPDFFVNGEVVEKNVNVRAIYGNFRNYIATCSVQDFENSFHELKKKFRLFADTSTNEASIVLAKNSKILWQRYKLPPNAKDFYDFSYLGFLLNELPVDITKLPPTDSRFRLDIRKMEEGKFDEASDIKKILEDKQRLRAKEDAKKLPMWFKLIKNNNWQFTNTYWNRNYECCANIY